MPRPKKTKEDELVDLLLKDQDPMELLNSLTAKVMNRALDAELTEHLDYESGAAPPDGQSNRRNGHRTKKVRTSRGEVPVKVPRDRDGSYEPKLLRKYQRAIPGFDEKLLGLYARGMSTRDIHAFFQEEYGVSVSADLVSRVTDSVVDELKAWQQRPLQSLYAIIYIDALVVKVRDEGTVTNKSLYIAIGVDQDGEREVLGLWLQRTEGAKFWLSVLTELKHRGVDDVLFLCADGLTGLPDAVEAAFPKATFQTCVVHLIRASTRLVAWRDKKAVCRDLRRIYTAANDQAAMSALDAFEEAWGTSYPMVGEAWRRRFDEWSPFLAFSPSIRRAIYTTNLIEATNRQVRKVLKTKGALPSDDAVFKLVYLVLRSQADKWDKQRRTYDWTRIRVELNIHFNDRFPIDL